LLGVSCFKSGVTHCLVPGAYLGQCYAGDVCTHEATLLTQLTPSSSHLSPGIDFILLAGWNSCFLAGRHVLTFRISVCSVKKFLPRSQIELLACWTE
jgi:hypothetical protein